MGVLISLILVIISHILILNYRIDTLNIYNFICQLYLNKSEKKKKKKNQSLEAVSFLHLTW